jgi:hypothetical protein
VQVTGFVPVQTPAWQLSVWVQELPSLHEEPSALAGFEHVPVVGLHVPGVWHWSGVPQITGLPPTHTPAWQLSFCVHAFLSSQPAPSALLGFEQTPLPGSQVPTSWHWSAAVQVTGFVPVQTPV